MKFTLLACCIGVAVGFTPSKLAKADVTEFLRVGKAGGQPAFTFKGSEVFLSGANLAWFNYGADFGNNQTNGAACQLQSFVRNISESGGNSVRVWLFVEGASIPAFDAATGHVTATDGAGSLAADLTKFLRYAATQDVFVTLCLWNGALMREADMKALITDSPTRKARMQSYLDNALKPMVAALAGEPALMAYEIMNEPEGSVKIASDSEPCFDTKTVLSGSGAGWSGAAVSMRDLQRFVNVQAAAIHSADPTALVTVGSWSEYASTDRALQNGRRFFNYWKDECLVKAGGVPAGTLDFFQIHTYADGPGTFHPGSPMADSRTAADFGLGRPLVIGEFSSAKCAAHGCSPASLYRHALQGGFSGAWDWAWQGGQSDGNDDAAQCVAGMAALKGEKRVHLGGALRSEVQPLADTCGCSDTPPDGSSYSCAQQASWGKCGESFMRGFCCKSCFGCKGCAAPSPTPPAPPAPPAPATCSDTPPDGSSYSCAQQASWGKCGESWMAAPKCCESCHNCEGTGCGAAPAPAPPATCSDTPPDGSSYSCAQQASWGKCGESWMAGKCCKSCRHCASCS